MKDVEGISRGLIEVLSWQFRGGAEVNPVNYQSGFKRGSPPNTSTPITSVIYLE
jgi:hypothetical protein